MYNSSLFQIIKTLSSDEFERLGDFLRSPLHNSSQMCLKLYDLIAKTYPRLEAPALSKESAMIKLFKGKTDSEASSLRNLMSQLKGLVEQFLCYNEFMSQEETHYRQYLLLRSLNQRELGKQYEQIYKYERQTLDQIQLKNEDYFRARYLTEQLDYRVRISQQSKGQITEKLREVLFHLDTFYLLNKLKYNAVSKLNQLNIHQQAINAEQLKDIVSNNTLEKHPSLQLYYLISLLFSENENHKIHFSEFKRLLFQYTDNKAISDDDLSNMYTFATVFCTRQWKTGDTDYLNDILVLYEKMLDNKLLHSNNHIVPLHFKNIVIVGLRAKRYDWVDKIINEYTQQIAPNYREPMLYFSRALWHFYQKHYDEALNFFHHYDLLDNLYPLDRRTFLLRIYYETNASYIFTDFTYSFERFVRETHRLRSQQNRRAYLNFISLARQLFNAKTMPDVRQDIIQRIERKMEQLKTKPISDRQWIMDKLNELKNARKR